MKILLLASLILTVSTVSAREIQGTLVLKGATKTKIKINNKDTNCKVRIEKVRNLLDAEDSFGNPAYQVRTQIELNGNPKVKFNKQVIFINLFQNGAVSQVEDLKFFAKDDPTITMRVDEDGGVKQVSFPLQNQNIVCNF